MTFQTRVNTNQPPAFEGDFASANAHASYPAGNGRLVAGPLGVTIARFAWVDPASLSVSNAGTGAPSGFIHRENQARITQWLGETSMLIPTGIMVTVLTQGDFWVRSANAGTRGQSVFASTTDGSIKAGAKGSTVAGSVETKWQLAEDVAAGELVKITSWGV